MKVKAIFQGASGLRVVWRLLIFLAVFAGSEAAIQTAVSHFAPSLLALEMALRHGALSPKGLITSEIVNLVCVAIALVVMALYRAPNVCRLWTSARRRLGEAIV